MQIVRRGSKRDEINVVETTLREDRAKIPVPFLPSWKPIQELLARAGASTLNIYIDIDIDVDTEAPRQTRPTLLSVT